MVTILAFVVLGGGTALASYVISSNGQVGPGTISGHKPPSGDHSNIIPGSVNGTDLANGAVTASKLGAVAKFHTTNNAPTLPIQVLSLGGLRVVYRCFPDAPDNMPTLTAKTLVNHAAITLTYRTGDSLNGQSLANADGDFLTSDSFDLTPNVSSNSPFGGGTAVYSAPNGNVVTLTYGYNTPPCLVHGMAVVR